MEYLMTYGWAILIIAIVLVALYALGVFNSANYAPKAPPGSCKVYQNNAVGSQLVGLCTNEIPKFVEYSKGGSSVSVPTTFNPNGGNFTAIAWIYSIDNPSWNAYVIFHNSSTDGWQMDTNPSQYGGICRSRFDTPSGTNQVASGPYSINIHGGWHMCVIVYNATTQTATEYTDGVAGSPKTITGSLPTGTLTTRLIVAGNWDGELANIQIYSTTLSASEIKSLYSYGIGADPIMPKYLVGWWPLNGDANDYSGNGYNGNMTGSVGYIGTWYGQYTHS